MWLDTAGLTMGGSFRSEILTVGDKGFSVRYVASGDDAAEKLPVLLGFLLVIRHRAHVPKRRDEGFRHLGSAVATASNDPTGEKLLVETQDYSLYCERLCLRNSS